MSALASKIQDIIDAWAKGNELEWEARGCILSWSDRMAQEIADGLPVPDDIDDLDAVVHELGIEDTFITPATAVRELKQSLEYVQGDCLEANEKNKNLECVLKQAESALEQAQDCIRGETPEDMTHEEAREDTISKIRDALRAIGGLGR